MNRHLTISALPIDEAQLRGECDCGPDNGAILYFLGNVRRMEGERPIQAIEYEAFKPMVEHQFELLFAEVERRWPVQSVRLVHRVGWVGVGEPSLWIEVKALHRGEAFAACQFLIDEMKRVVPIWKKPIYE